MKRYYVYRWVGQNGNEVKYLGYFETDRPLHKVWELMFQVFCGDGSDGGMFVRKELL